MYACNKNNSWTSRISTFGELDLQAQGQAHWGNLLNKHLNWTGSKSKFLFAIENWYGACACACARACWNWSKQKNLHVIGTNIQADVNGPKFTYPGLLWAVHMGPNFKVKNKLSTLIYSWNFCIIDHKNVSWHAPVNVCQHLITYTCAKQLIRNIDPLPVQKWQHKRGT